MTEELDVFASPSHGNESGGVRDFIKNGRYFLPDPHTGKDKYWSRASTIAHTLSDTYHLNRWNDRVIVKGMGLRPDLAALAASLDVTDDKAALQEIAETAKEAAGAKVGANNGTALHAHAERLDGGEDMSTVRMTLGTRNDLKAYAETMTEYGFVTYPDLMERIIINTELGIAGRIDRVLFDPLFWDLPKIGDLKTQKNMDFGALEQAIQLAIYANADFMWNMERGEWEEFPQVDTNVAKIMHLPVGQARCEIFDVDIANGWRCAKLAMNVRKSRNIGKGLVTPAPNDRQFRIMIQDAVTVDDLSMVWRVAHAAGVWNSDIQTYGMKRKAEIEALAIETSKET